MGKLSSSLSAIVHLLALQGVILTEDVILTCYQQSTVMIIDLDCFVHIPPLIFLSKKVHLPDGWQDQEAQSMAVETKASYCYSNTKQGPI